MELIPTVGIREYGKVVSYVGVCVECERFDYIEAYGCCPSCV